MIHFAIYTGDGIIVRAGSTDAMTWPQVQAFWPRQPGEELAQTAHAIKILENWRVTDGIAVERSTMTPTVSAPNFAADGVDSIVISDLPTPCQVTISGAVTAGPLAVTDGAVELTSTERGTIKIRVEAAPAYKTWETTIHAT